MEAIFLRNAPKNNQNFWLVAESGYAYRSAANTGKWTITENKQYDFTWKNKVRKIMKGYEENIDGSYIEERQSCILWNYKNGEPEHVTMHM